MNKFLSTCVAIAIATSTSIGSAEDATVKVRFEYADAPPAMKKVAAFRGNDLFDESLIVGEDGGIENVVLSIYTGRGGTDVEDLNVRLANKKITLANDKCRFEPHVMVAQQGDTLEITNQGNVGLNVNLGFFAIPPQNLVIAAKQSVKVDLKKVGPGASPIDCNIHPWMKAYLLILDHPYGAVSDDNGEVTITGLPAGKELTFRVFHEKGAIKTVTEKESGEERELKRARFEMELQPGMNDLGTWIVPTFK